MADMIESEKVIEVQNAALVACKRRIEALEHDVATLKIDIEEQNVKITQLVALVDQHEVRLEVVELVVKPSQKGRAN
jgi:uncharacterized coiled-coil protein SlyX